MFAQDLDTRAAHPLPQGPRGVRRASSFLVPVVRDVGGSPGACTGSGPHPPPQGAGCSSQARPAQRCSLRGLSEPSPESLLQPQGLFRKRGEPTLRGTLFMPAVLPWAGSLSNMRGCAGNTQPCEEPLPQPWMVCSAPPPLSSQALPPQGDAGRSYSGGPRTRLDTLLFDSRKNRMMLTIYIRDWFGGRHFCVNEMFCLFGWVTSSGKPSLMPSDWVSCPGLCPGACVHACVRVRG